MTSRHTFALVLCVVMISSHLSTQDSPRPITVPAKFDDLTGGLHLIPVSINGRTFWCNLDSGGSAVLSLDEREGELAGFKADSTGTSAGVGPAVIQDRRMPGASVRVGSVVISNQTIVMRPYPPEIPEMDCIMGVALLRQYVVEFDYTTPEIRLFDPRNFQPRPSAIATPFRLDRNNPIAEITVALPGRDRVRASVVLDTGAAYYSAAFAPAFAATHQLLNRIGATAKRPVRHKGTGGEIDIVSARLRSVELGPVRVADPIVGVIRTESAGFPWEGVLGAGFLRRFTATFDYSRQQLWLAPNAAFAERQPFDASGVGFRRDEAGRHVVDVVVPGSKAAESLRQGDVLISIDGQNADGLVPKQVVQILSRPGRTCVMSIRRQGEIRSVTLFLQTRL